MRDDDIRKAQEAAHIFLNWSNAARYAGNLLDKIERERMLYKVELDLSKALKHMRNPK